MNRFVWLYVKYGLLWMVISHLKSTAISALPYLGVAQADMPSAMGCIYLADIVVGIVIMAFFVREQVALWRRGY